MLQYVACFSIFIYSVGHKFNRAKPMIQAPKDIDTTTTATTTATTITTTAAAAAAATTTTNSSSSSEQNAVT